LPSAPSATESTAAASTAPDSTALETTAASSGDTRIVETSFGDIELPVDPQRVIALDEYAAMNLLAVGIEPMETYTAYSSLVSQDILAERGVELMAQEDSFAVNFEAIAGSDPDVIVVTAESAVVESVEPLQDIAPTVIVPYTAPWRDVITDTGNLFGRTDEAASVIEALEGKLASTSEAVAANPYSLSILGETFGILFAVSPEAVLSAIVDEVGVDRPPAQADATSMEGFNSVISLSPELVVDHDADVVTVMSGVFYPEDALLDLPTYQSLPAVQDGRSTIVDGDMWFGTHPFAIYWILEDLASLAEGVDGIGTIDDAEDRWSAYQELLG
ncbi:MAG: ABC transporter substrate-binding protein, partial [Actinomycetota bacterium]